MVKALNNAHRQRKTGIRSLNRQGISKSSPSAGMDYINQDINLRPRRKLLTARSSRF